MNFSKKTHKHVGQNKQLEPKKNPKADVSRNTSIYFAVGLLLMLIVSYVTINYKSYEKNDLVYGGDPFEYEIEDEIIPLIKEVKKLPPPVKVIKPDTDIKDDDDDVKETIMDDTETDEDDEILEIDEIIVIEEPDESEIPIDFIQNVPIFPGCEKGSNSAKRNCMSQKISKFVQKKFNTNLAESLGLTGKQKIYVTFKISKQGHIIGVKSRAPHPRLQTEAARVINLLPKMKPGIQNGKEVIVSYSLPIIFVVQD